MATHRMKSCGIVVNPSQTASRFITRGARFPQIRSSDIVIGRHGGDYYFSEEVQIEEWIFNFGPNKLMRKVTFENGIVVDVDTLKYGYHEN